ncbi:MAG: hypothetical protein Greene041619_565 [Candidatus Peregrinibacteria bacterium Greene0416_19]|nr:MAG: hypothetical protein Greene041619_565 [Candidatus Peregrinibacteria bacterium Greene0416_19]
MFLIVNEANFADLTKDQLKVVLTDSFPKHVWEENLQIRGDHSLFLYNLAIALGDRTRWESDDFGTLREKVAKLFRFLYWLPVY